MVLKEALENLKNINSQIWDTINSQNEGHAIRSLRQKRVSILIA